MDFKSVDKKYRPIPFWSWNEKLEVKETAEQIRMMDEAGIGGYFMHARGGLLTDYMGEEWFENVSVAINEGKKRGMGAWAYDENGWPSGFGNGVVTGKGLEYQQKYLRMSDVEPKENLITKAGDRYFYFDINPFYVDVLDKKVIAEFIKTAYEPYYERFGDEIEGFFTDEPQISRNGIPWSFVFEDEYRKRYSENILEHLPELFLETGDYKNTRIKFWKMVTDLFSESYFKQIYDWCEAHGVKFTGHLVQEEAMRKQIISNGACMPHYEYFHVPGMDWLERNIEECLTPLQLGSVAEQLGKEQVLSETFAMCGHNISFDELKGIFEWQMARGVNLLCQHLEGYSLRGIRKRDYPPAMYYQQPWWSEYRAFVDAMSREGMILSKGRKKVEVLLIHPQTTAWTLFNAGSNPGLYDLDMKFYAEIKKLEEKHISFHLGDETILERHGKVEGDRLVVGKQAYTYVLNPCGEVLLPNTERLLAEFKANGGRFNAFDELPECNVTDNGEITYKTCELENCRVHFFVNTSGESRKARINVRGKKLDIYTGDLSEFSRDYEFEPWESLMVIDEGAVTGKSDCGENICQEEVSPESKALEGAENFIFLPEKAMITRSSENVLTMDFCDYFFDGKLEEEKGYVLNICERANKLKRKVHIKQVYHVKAEYVPETLFLAVETPELFDVLINDKEVTVNPQGYFRDKSFRKIDISGFMKVGDNTITFECDFEQSKSLYENLEKAYVFESEKNKLSYDREIEAIYLLGDFSVKTEGNWEALDRNASRYRGDFVIAEPVREVSLKHLEKQGFAFFSGEMTLKAVINVNGDNPVLKLNRRGVNVAKIRINGVEKTIVSGNNVNLGDFGASGDTKVEITILNNLRNMLGPHHLKEGECYSVCPSSFFKEPCIWNLSPEQDWDEGYCFTELSL